MNPQLHERACRLIDAWQVEGISPSERDWLETHLAECPECQARAQANERALQALRSNSLAVDPTLVSATQARVRARAYQLRESRARLRALGIACGLSWLLGALTAPLLWQTLSWLGSRFEISRAIWITVFAFCWLAPASVVGAVMAWKYSHDSGEEKQPEAWGR